MVPSLNLIQKQNPLNISGFCGAQNKYTPGEKHVIFSFKFVKKNGELVFIPRAVADGLRFNRRDDCIHGILPVDVQNNTSGHLTLVLIKGLVEC